MKFCIGDADPEAADVLAGSPKTCAPGVRAEVVGGALGSEKDLKFGLGTGDPKRSVPGGRE